MIQTQPEKKSAAYPPPVSELRRQQNLMHEVPMLEVLLNAVPISVVVLNADRDIIFSNMAFLDFTEQLGVTDHFGRKIGAVLQCVNAGRDGLECGSSKLCTLCGIKHAIERTKGDLLEGFSTVHECRILTKEEVDLRSLDLRVWSTVFTHGGETFTILYLMDVSDQKRRAVLEKIFFHDVLNLAGAVLGMAEVIEVRADEDDHRPRMLLQISERLVEEIQAQRDLVAAERGDLEIQPKTVQALDVISGLVGTYITHNVAKGKSLSVVSESEDVALHTDPVLLGRVLGNMLKNALEASYEGDAVRIGVCREDESARFWVVNDAYIPEELQAEMFKRSFSTKGDNRGLGTYSMKLLTEEYLHGSISFSSTLDSGTRFDIIVPQHIAE